MLADRPPAIVARAGWQLVGGDFDESLAIGVGNPMTRRENLGHHDRLNSVEVLVVVNFAIYLLLNDLMLVWFDHFVCDSSVEVSTS